MLTYKQCLILKYMQDHQSYFVTPNDIEDAMNITSHSFWSIMSHLEKKYMVMRQSDKGEFIGFRITNLGREQKL